jgi:hypothetical protein
MDLQDHKDLQEKMLLEKQDQQELMVKTELMAIKDRQDQKDQLVLKENPEIKEQM